MKKINGPINVVRMEGSINGIKKVIYFFMDKHFEVQNQTDCNDPDNSINIAEYFKNNFIKLKDKNKTYDFFLEFSPELIAYQSEELYFTSDPKMKYIQTVGKFFRESVKYDVEKNKLLSLFDNVRLHYIDVRSTIQNYLYPILQFLDRAIENNNTNIHKFVAGSIIAIIKLMEIILQTLKNKENLPEKINITAIKKFDIPLPELLGNADLRKEYFDHLVYLMNKFLHGYTNQNVKNIIHHYIDILVPELEFALEDLINLYNEAKELNFESYQNTSIKNKFANEFKKIEKYLTLRFAILVDLYFLRRFLDKKYITNAVVYTGTAHSVICIYILNSIGFKITHCANCSIQDMADLNSAVTNVSNFPFVESIISLLEIFLQSPTNPQQCSDLSQFPELFE